MLKEAAAVTGGTLLLPPLGVAVVSCGVSGLLVAGAGMFFAKTMMKERRAAEETPRISTAPFPDGNMDYSIFRNDLP